MGGSYNTKEGFYIMGDPSRRHAPGTRLGRRSYSIRSILREGVITEAETHGAHRHRSVYGYTTGSLDSPAGELVMQAGPIVLR
jgi:hypothetical protein